MNDRKPSGWVRRFSTVASLTILSAPLMAASRPFLMGTQPFFLTPTLNPFPDFVFENLSDKDMISMHIDDNLGIPWPNFENNTPLPAAWASRMTSLSASMQASGKVIYLSLTPLDGYRKTLAGTVDASGNKTEGWAPSDGAGCYPFATDANAAAYKTAYIRYAHYMIDTFHPSYVTLTIETNMEFAQCPAEKSAFIQWTNAVADDIKTSYPNLPTIPTFQVDFLYGFAAGTAYSCGSETTDADRDACFTQHFQEALTVKGDRIGLSLYPVGWSYLRTGGFPLADTFNMIQSATSRPIWISETGWPQAALYNAYDHASPPSSCGTVAIDSNVASGTFAESYLENLLQEAQARKFEGVVWFLNRDFMDANTASNCPCAGTNDTCSLASQLYGVGGTGIEVLFRSTANNGLRNLDGTPHPVYSVWSSFLTQPLSITPYSNLAAVQIYPNPMRPSQGHTGINFNQLPSGARVRVYTLAGEKVRDLTADATGHTMWDGTNGARKKAASGVYFVLVEGAGDKETFKVAIQR